jgi:alkylation response protein AidB-like acyl-CoA dehydrogenase
MNELVSDHERSDFSNAVCAVLDRRLVPGSLRASPELWLDLAELGLLGLCTDAVGGGPRDLVVGFDALGRGLCPGPIVATVALAPSLPLDVQREVMTGATMVTVTDGTIVPWGGESGCIVEFNGDYAWVVAASGPLQPTETLSGEEWATGGFTRREPLVDPGRARVRFELALSAYLAGAAYQLILRAADYVRVRQQFGRTLGEFQAVAHPLAVSYAEISALRALCDGVALEAVAGPLPRARSLALRRQAGAASRRAAVSVHQAMGAVGFSLESGISDFSRRIQQWSVLPPWPGRQPSAETVEPQPE